MPEASNFLSCFGDFCGFSYFFLDFFRLMDWFLGAVLGIFAASATFFWIFFGLWTGFGSCFGDFCGFSYFFTRFFPAYGLSLRAVLEIFAVSATFLVFFPAYGLNFGSCFKSFMDYSSSRPAHYAINLGLLYIMLCK